MSGLNLPQPDNKKNPAEDRLKSMIDRLATTAERLTAQMERIERQLENIKPPVYDPEKQEKR